MARPEYRQASARLVGAVVRSALGGDRNRLPLLPQRQAAAVLGRRHPQWRLAEEHPQRRVGAVDHPQQRRSGGLGRPIRVIRRVRARSNFACSAA